MRVLIGKSSVGVWLSARDTYNWAHRPGHKWPCSTLSGHRLYALFDFNGLCEVTLDGHQFNADAHEFNACIADHLAAKLPKGHPAYLVVVGQFNAVTPG